MTLFKMNRQLPTLPFAHPETSKTTLWMGDLDKHWDEQYVQQIWFGLGEKVLVKIIRDKSRDVNYAFVDFGNPAKAAFALQTYNGALIPNHQQKRFKLNWATGGGLFDRKEDKQPEYSIFVGDLSPDWTDSMLLSVFANRYPSCKSARIMTNSETGLSRGYGFVRFTDPADQQRALAEMNGATFGPLNRPMRVCLATPKHRPSSSATNTTTSPTAKSPTLQQDDPHNTTVFVGGLSTPITEQELREYFRPFGEILYTKIPPGKGCGFVQFVSRRSAELAIQQMNGFAIGNSRIRLSWGRSQNDKSAAAAAANAAAALAAMTKQNQLLQPLSSSCRPYYDPVTDLSTTDTPFQSFGQQLQSDILPRRRPSFLGSFSSSPPNSRPIDWDAFNTRLLDLTKSDSTSNATNSTTPSSTWSLNHIYAQ